MSLTPEQRERLAEAAYAHRTMGADIAPVVADLLTEQREQIARDFETEAVEAWGRDAAWLTTGTKVGQLAAEWVRGSHE